MLGPERHTDLFTDISTDRFFVVLARLVFQDSRERYFGMSERGWTFIILVSLCAVAGAGWVDPVCELNEEGIRLYEREKYKGSVEKFSSIRRLTKEPAVVHFNLGNSYYKLGKYDLAIREYFRAARSTDKDLRAKAYHNLGNCQYHRGELEKALHYFRKAIKLDHNDEDTRVNYEFVLSKLSKATPPADDTTPGGDREDVGEIPTADNSHEIFIDEKDREMIYDMLEVEERSNRKKVRFRDNLSGGEKGKNW